MNNGKAQPPPQKKGNKSAEQAAPTDRTSLITLIKFLCVTRILNELRI